MPKTSSRLEEAAAKMDCGKLEMANGALGVGGAIERTGAVVAVGFLALGLTIWIAFERLTGEVKNASSGDTAGVGSTGGLRAAYDGAGSLP